MTMHDKPHLSMKCRKRLNGCARSLAAVFMLTITVPVLHADIVARDNFDYSLGSIDGANDGVGNWTGAWNNFGRDAHSELVSPATPLTYSAGVDAYTLGGGTALQFTRQADSVQTPVLRSFSGLAAGESVYFRYLLRLDSDTWDSTDFFTGWLDSDSGAGELDVRGDGPNLGLRAANAGSNDFFARVSNDTGAEAIPSIAFASQTTYLIVGLYEDSDNDGFYDTASIWINPTSADAGSPHAVSTVGISSIPDPMACLGWRFGNNLNTNDILLVDDVAVTTTFDSAIGVIPEPGTIGLMLIGLLCCAGTVRRRNRLAK